MSWLYITNYGSSSTLSLSLCSAHWDMRYEIWDMRYDHWEGEICAYMLFNSYFKNIIQFRFQANWKWNNNYSNTNIQYNINLLNILNKEIKKRNQNTVYAYEKRDSLT